jgi:hypothetical protein
MFAARIGPTVWELEGPMPTLYISKTLITATPAVTRCPRRGRRLDYSVIRTNITSARGVAAPAVQLMRTLLVGFSVDRDLSEHGQCVTGRGNFVYTNDIRHALNGNAAATEPASRSST